MLFHVTYSQGGTLHTARYEAYDRKHAIRQASFRFGRVQVVSAVALPYARKPLPGVAHADHSD
jgi:hypothetical protein